MDASTRITNTYANVNQLLPVSTNLQRLIRSAVAPAPTYLTGIPIVAVRLLQHLHGQPGGRHPVADVAHLLRQHRGPQRPGQDRGELHAERDDRQLRLSGHPHRHGGQGHPDGKPGRQHLPVRRPEQRPCTWSSTPITLLTVKGLTNGLNSVPLFTYTLLVHDDDDRQQRHPDDDVLDDALNWKTGSKPHACHQPAAGEPGTGPRRTRSTSGAGTGRTRATRVRTAGSAAVTPRASPSPIPTTTAPRPRSRPSPSTSR